MQPLNRDEFPWVEETVHEIFLKNHTKFQKLLFQTQDAKCLCIW